MGDVLIQILVIILCIGGWLAYVWWDSRRTWRDESGRYDAAIKEHDRRRAREGDAMEDYQKQLEALERAVFNAPPPDNQW